MRLARLVPVAAVLFLAGAAAAQPVQPLPGPPALLSPVKDKNFFVLSALERNADVLQALIADPDLAPIAAAKREALLKAARACDGCLKEIQFRDSEIVAAGAALERFYQVDGAMRSVVDGMLRDSGMYVRYHDKEGAELLVRAWEDAARNVNRIIEVYGAGKKPRYPAIDSASFDTATPAFRLIVETIAGVLGEKRDSMPAFFQPTLQFALYLLQANRRDEAGRHEPMETGENKAAFRRVASIRWDRFPYTVIVVPGAGGDRPGWNLSAAGRLRTELAALRYRQGKAPFILVSGGYVHPNQTPFAEAIEMKRLLVGEYGIPADAVIVDPHARHTTTNLRNAARLLYRYGIPFDRKVLVTTDKSQSTYIEGPLFAKRCQDELGYQPGNVLARISMFDLEFLPRLDSLQADATDPLDP